MYVTLLNACRVDNYHSVHNSQFAVDPSGIRHQSVTYSSSLTPVAFVRTDAWNRIVLIATQPCAHLVRIEVCAIAQAHPICVRSFYNFTYHYLCTTATHVRVDFDSVVGMPAVHFILVRAITTITSNEKFMYYMKSMLFWGLPNGAKPKTRTYVVIPDRMWISFNSVTTAYYVIMFARFWNCRLSASAPEHVCSIFSQRT